MRGMVLVLGLATMACRPQETKRERTERRDGPRTVSLAPQALEAAGVELVQSSRASFRPSVSAGGFIRSDARRSVTVRASGEGRVVRVAVDVGATVKAGDTLVVVESPEANVALSRHRGLGLSPRTFGRLARALRLPLLGSPLVRYARKQYRRRGFGGVEEMTARDFARHFQSIAALDFAHLRRLVEGPLPPTLIAYARDDRMVETWISEELVAALPHARVLAFDEGGHNLQKTRAAELERQARWCREHGVDVTTVYRISENQSPDALGLMRRGEIRLVINTPTNSTGSRRDGYMMRRLAVDLNIPFIPTIQAAVAAAQAIEETRSGDLDVRSLQSYAASARGRATKL